jgi:hypothetical protein
MAKETIGAQVQIEYKSVGELRKGLKDATGELLRMQQQFGATSKEAMAAAKRVADIRDRMQEAKEVADLFDPGNKFKVLGNAAASAAGGFSALQGAMGLLGVESKEVEKQLLKVQSAMALSQGLSTLADSGKDFARLAAVIKGPVVAAFTTLRGAMMALGIGLITSAVALLVQNFDKVKAVVYQMFPALEGLFDNMDRIMQIAMGVGNAILQFVLTPAKTMIKIIQGDFEGAMNELKSGYNVVKNFREGEQKEIKAQADERAADAAKKREEELKKQKEHNDKVREQQRAHREKMRQEQLEFEEQQRQDMEAYAEWEREQDAIEREELEKREEEERKEEERKRQEQLEFEEQQRQDFEAAAELD